MGRRLALWTALALLAVALSAPAAAQPVLVPRLYLPLLGKVCPPPLPVAANAIQIIDVVPYNPNFPDDSEYIQILNTAGQPIAIGGWRVVNTSSARQETYFFPQFTLDEDFSAVIFSGKGTNNPLVGDFFWGLSAPIWRAGHVAELRATECQVISRFVVGP